jgi:CubicO group peptidase (beta-lactamase class C family)
MSKFLSAATAALLWSFAGVSTAAPTPAPTIDEAFAKVTSVVRSANLPGEIVLADADRSTRIMALGSADPISGRRNQIGQRWLWASVTKQITAILVLQEVERGRIALDAPLGQYLPKFGGDQAITVRQLLQHRSGLPNPSDTTETNGIAAFYMERGAAISNAARAHNFCSGAAKRPRGGNWEYNNCDYFVLGAVLEAVSGRPYGEIVRDRIARPLGLSTLRVARDDAVLGGSAATPQRAQARFADMNVATGGAAAGLTGSAVDLAAIDRALMTGRILSSTTLATAWQGDPALGYMALGVWSYTVPLLATSPAPRCVTSSPLTWAGPLSYSPTTLRPTLERSGRGAG